MAIQDIRLDWGGPSGLERDIHGQDRVAQLVHCAISDYALQAQGSTRRDASPAAGAPPATPAGSRTQLGLRAGGGSSASTEAPPATPAVDPGHGIMSGPKEQHDLGEDRRMST
jgi:hypothetical protein